MLTGCHPQATVTVAGSASQVTRLEIESEK